MAELVAEVDIFAFTPRIAERYAHRAHQYVGLDQRTAYKIMTSSGVVGWGESRGGPPAAGAYEHLVGKVLVEVAHGGLLEKPAQLPPVGNRNHDAGVECALFDALGKHLHVPVHALLGRKLRDHVPVAAWTTTCGPVDFAADVQRAVDDGYMAMKMHTSPFWDVIEQTRAAEAVAPPGFRLHYDFNSARSLANVLPVVRELEAHHPIVAVIEDALKSSDIEGYQQLRAQTTIPLIMQDVPLGHVEMLRHGLADAYMIGCMSGRYLLADALGFGWACASTNTPLVVQEIGGGGILGKALALHLACVLPTCTLPMICLDDQYEDTFYRDSIPVLGGSSPVPAGPGLGIDVDEAVLRQMAARTPIPMPAHIPVLRIPSHRLTMYGAIPREVLGLEEGLLKGQSYEAWLDDGTEAYRAMADRVRQEPGGHFIEASPAL
jgi:L-alanine-DL-glutamate epimerase-like enolase superfamily enzyme